MKYRLTLLFSLLFFISSAAACEKAPAGDSAPDNSRLVKEGFSYDGSSVLRVYGSKDEDMALRITTRFMTSSPECAGMYVLERPDQISLSKPGKGPAGKYYLTRIAFKREKEYEIEMPLQLQHPQCEWVIAGMDFYVGNDFNWGKERIPRGGGCCCSITLCPSRILKSTMV